MFMFKGLELFLDYVKDYIIYNILKTNLTQKFVINRLKSDVNIGPKCSITFIFIEPKFL